MQNYKLSTYKLLSTLNIQLLTLLPPQQSQEEGEEGESTYPSQPSYRPRDIPLVRELYHRFLVLVNGVGSYYNPVPPSVPPVVEIDGIAACAIRGRGVRAPGVCHTGQDTTSGITGIVAGVNTNARASDHVADKGQYLAEAWRHSKRDRIETCGDSNVGAPQGGAEPTIVDKQFATDGVALRLFPYNFQ